MRQKTKTASRTRHWSCAAKISRPKFKRKKLKVLDSLFPFLNEMEIITRTTPHVVILEKKISAKETFTEKCIIMIRWDVSGNFQIVPHTQDD